MAFYPRGQNRQRKDQFFLLNVCRPKSLFPPQQTLVGVVWSTGRIRVLGWVGLLSNLTQFNFLDGIGSGNSDRVFYVLADPIKRGFRQPLVQVLHPLTWH